MVPRHHVRQRLDMALSLIAPGFRVHWLGYAESKGSLLRARPGTACEYQLVWSIYSFFVLWQ